MWLQKLVFILFVVPNLCQDYYDDITTEDADETVLADGEKKLSDMILRMLEHFKQPDPVGLPGAEVSDPYHVPDMRHSPAFGTTVYFKDTSVHGISQFRILYVDAEVASMEVKGAMSVDALQARGNYTLSTWFETSHGPYTVDVKGLNIMARANLGVERDGKLRAQDISIDMSFNTIAVNFENLGLLGNIFQGFINSIGSFIFDTIKPHMLKEFYGKIRTGINNKLDQISGDIEFPNSISPFDMVLIDVRNKMYDMKLDPYEIKNYNGTVSIFDVELTNTWISGISTLHRIGNISLKLENKTLVTGFEIGTHKLEGRTQWDVATAGKFMSRSGTSSFSVEYFRIHVILEQPLDTRVKTRLRDLDLEIGNIQVRFDGAGTLDYVIEFAVNILPNLLRYQIVNAFEGPLKHKVQRELNEVDMEALIIEQLPNIERIANSGFKLADLKSMKSIYDEDEFFNF